MPLEQNFLTETPRKAKTSSVPQNVKPFDSLSLKEDLHSELQTSIFDEGMLPSTTYNGDIIADCWFPDKILPVVPDARLLSMLMGPDGKPLYDSSTKQWNTSYLPPILRSKPSGLQERLERLHPAEEEKELSTFMTTLMDALISYYESTPTSVPQGTEASFAATTTPTAPILDTSPLLHSSSGSHSDPGAPTVPQGTEVSSPNDPAPDPLSLPLNTVGAASTPGTTFIPAESIFDTSPPSFIHPPRDYSQTLAHLH
ncbi:hypothetical protein EDD15DRAFT_2375270 [Pisolithus albus]|nr:hypothetical protein EDD15DRAFT_2375270 [Pisolithus albus]